MTYTQKILAISTVGAVGAAGLDWILSGTEVTGVRIALALMLAAGGFVATGLVAAMFLEPEDEDHAEPTSD
jgi:hypothetical protein